MAPNLGVGATLDDTIASLNRLVNETLQSACENSAQAEAMVNRSGIYEGAAKERLQSFYKQYSQKITTLSEYYGYAKDYLEMAKTEIENADQMLAQYITEVG